MKALRIHFNPALCLRQVALALLIPSSTAPGQLALIRQGRESTGVAEPGDFHGGAVALGDFNGDGWDDLATGAPFEKTGSPTFSSGLVVINWGTPYGLTWENSTSLSVIDGSFDPAKNSQMGKALAFGDFNGDKIQDLAVGLPAAEVGGQSAAGAVFIYYGGASVSGSAQLLTQGQLGAANEGGDLFGSALATGRIGNDDYDDLIIGSPGENSTAGAVFIVRGGSLGLNTSQRQIILASDIGGASVAGNQFGTSVAVGDVVGLANEDLVIGEPFAEVTGGVPFSGRAFVVIGTNAGVALNNVLAVDASTVGDFPFSHGDFGAALAIGDLWGDGGTLDLVIGSPGAHLGGRAYVGRGSPLGITWPVTLMQNLNSATGGESNPDEANDNFGDALAIGDHDDDGFDDLAVGCPGEDIEFFGVFGVGAGAVHIFPGSNGGPVQANATTYLDFNLGDDLAGEGRLGYALAAGRTSASPRHSFVVGAPYKNSSHGQVYDIAPWRQVLTPLCRSALAADCEDNIIYALKPFEQVKIASTTKTMTLLLGCEATTRPPADPLHVGLNEIYTIEDWMYDGFPLTSGCSIYGFTPLPTGVLTEDYTFNDLLRICFPPSGNDVCYAIADKMTGEVAAWSGHTTSAPDFVQLMNDRAAQIGMNDTHFTNPAGVDNGSPYSTAYDMWLLAREAMDNPLFRDIAGSTEFYLDKIVPGAEAGLFKTANVNVAYNWLESMKNRDSRIVGVKPGGTPGAKKTGVVAARPGPLSTRFAHANGFRWFDSTTSKDKLAELAKLALSFCDTLVDGPTGLTGPIANQMWEMNDGQIQCIQFGGFDAVEVPGVPATGGHREGLIEVHGFSHEIDSPMDAKLDWNYRALWELAPGATSGVTVGPAIAASGYFRNISGEVLPTPGTAVIRLVSPSPGSTPQTIPLAPGAEFHAPDWRSSVSTGAEWSLKVTNAGSETIYLAFVGNFEFQPSFSGRAGEFFRGHLERLGKSLRDGHTICEGERPTVGSSVFSMQIIVENRTDGDRFLPPLKITRFSINPLEPTTDEWSVRFESALDPAPPLKAFYSGFDIETHDGGDFLLWNHQATVPATDADSYDWTGQLPHREKLFLRARGRLAD